MSDKNSFKKDRKTLNKSNTLLHALYVVAFSAHTLTICHALGNGKRANDPLSNATILLSQNPAETTHTT